MAIRSQRVPVIETAAEVDSGWMSSALRTAGVTTEESVIDVSCGHVGNGMASDTFRFTLAHDRPTTAPALTVKGRRQEVDPARVVGIRDRSWGWRIVGEPEGGVGRPLPEQVFWLWAPLIWRDECTHYGLFEGRDGKRSKQFGHIFASHATGDAFDPVADDDVSDVAAGRHGLTCERGARFVGRGTIALERPEGTQVITLEPLLRFHMYGIGYGHPEWGHGMWKGEEAYTSEHWNVSDIDPNAVKFAHVQQVVRATRGDEVGSGVLEQALLGPHDRYGLKGWIDPVD